jgi:hypothetical protein
MRLAVAAIMKSPRDARDAQERRNFFFITTQGQEHNGHVWNSNCHCSTFFFAATKLIAT